MNILTAPKITESVVIIAGKSNQATTIVHILQLSQPLPVLNNVDDCWIAKHQKTHSIELLFIPYGCDCRSCPLGKSIVKNKIKRVAFYNVPNDQVALSLLKEGVAGVFYADDPTDIIGKGSRFMLNNELWFKRSIISHYISLTAPKYLNFNQARELNRLVSNLSRRETEIFSLLASGAKNTEIADKLFISVHTVKSHVRQILKKLSVTSRKEVHALMADSPFLALNVMHSLP